MDIREVRRTDAENLLDEELEMLEDELTTGDYDAFYRKECEQLILDERHSRKVAHQKAKVVSEGASRSKVNLADAQLPHGLSSSVMVAPENLSPFNKTEEIAKTPFEIVSSDVAAIRRSDKSKSLFREYLRNQPLIDEAFLDANLSFFDDWEISALLDHLRLSEPFLEKYFSSLNADRIATTQLFSEEFFMRHFASFKAQLVLQKGKNPWRSKENRSKKLDTFLRLKGVHF